MFHITGNMSIRLKVKLKYNSLSNLRQVFFCDAMLVRHECTLMKFGVFAMQI